MSQNTRRNSERNAATESSTESEQHPLTPSRRHRLTLDALGELSAPADLADVATAVVKRETGTVAPDETAIDQLARKLHHRHLPKMDVHGVIDYDQHRNRVTSWS